MTHEDDTKNVVEQLLGLMGVTFESVTPSELHGRTVFIVKTPESHLLIGSHGTHLGALNHLVKRIVSKRHLSPEEKFDFHVDVGGYHDKLVEELQNKAHILAGRARSFKTNVEMDPMSSFERMIIHSLFQGSPDIKTESTGTGRTRRVVLKYFEEERGEFGI
jgi:spoIIIJ-associated protein